MEKERKKTHKAPKCPVPECKGHAYGTVDNVPGVALFSVDEETGEATWDGETKVEWDGQTSEKGPNGRVMLICDKCYGSFEAPEGFKVG